MAAHVGEKFKRLSPQRTHAVGEHLLRSPVEEKPEVFADLFDRGQLPGDQRDDYSGFDPAFVLESDNNPETQIKKLKEELEG